MLSLSNLHPLSTLPTFRSLLLRISGKYTFVLPMTRKKDRIINWTNTINPLIRTGFFFEILKICIKSSTTQINTPLRGRNNVYDSFTYMYHCKSIK